ncbi:hypothetical protein NQT62_13490 [Limnobacter humi]|uniref:GspL cytoplasmic actin-ATPase-like domain-containing protein n=1 Tax=Limnobacter humi TaxID=1778671 RepID=A0ABT1WJ68_9BURK|nr:hypothetical protein [Limnobacter humi]MCQ8897449.1 hypothetical protein [Limnobacter humi]
MTNPSAPMDCWWIFRTAAHTAWQVQRLEPTSQGWQGQPPQAWADFSGTAEHINSLSMPSTVVLINLPDEPCVAQNTARWCAVRQSPVRWHALPHTPELAALMESLQHYPARRQVVCEAHSKSGPDSVEYLYFKRHEHRVFEPWVQGLDVWPPSRLVRLRFSIQQALFSRRHWPVRLLLACVAASGVIMGSTFQTTSNQAPRQPTQAAPPQRLDPALTTPAEGLSTAQWQAWGNQLQQFGARGKKHVESLEFEWQAGVPTISVLQLDRVPRRLPKGCTAAGDSMVVCTAPNPKTAPAQ